MFSTNSRSCIKCNRDLSFDHFTEHSHICKDCLGKNDIELIEIKCEKLPELQQLIDQNLPGEPNPDFPKLMKKLSIGDKILELNDYDHEFNRIMESNMLLLDKSDFIFDDVIKVKRIFGDIDNIVETEE